jgi:hypothetical protein
MIVDRVAAAAAAAACVSAFQSPAPHYVAAAAAADSAAADDDDVAAAAAAHAAAAATAIASHCMPQPTHPSTQPQHHQTLELQLHRRQPGEKDAAALVFWRQNLRQIYSNVLLKFP